MIMTILEAMNWGRARLRDSLAEKVSADLHNPMLDAQVLLSHCLKKPTAYLFAHFEDELPAEIADRYQNLIERRAHHEPVAYIIGKKDFYNRTFLVNPNVLIPRPETEQLIDEAKKLIQDNTTIIDIGTGSGNIAVTLAAETEQPVVAIDIDQNALTTAQANAQEHRVEHLLSLLSGNLLEPFLAKNIRLPDDANSVIVANLPYGRIAQWPTLDPDVHLFEPKKAYIGGVDGLDLYDQLLQQLLDHRNLFPDQLTILLEIDPSQELSAPRLIQEYFSNAQIQTLKDLANKSRVIIAEI